MTTAIIFHEVQDGAVWAKAWKKGPGSRHEMFGELGIKCRTFRDPSNAATDWPYAGFIDPISPGDKLVINATPADTLPDSPGSSGSAETITILF